MPKYIDADAFEESVRTRYCKPCREAGKDYHGVYCRACWVDDMLGETDCAPAADVASVKHGRWIPDAERVFHWYCSECGYCIGVMKMDAKYCPKCGARLEGGNDER